MPKDSRDLIDWSGPTRRETLFNWPTHLQGIVSGYQERRGVPHGVQKDAIQNAWDARSSNKGKGWRFTFELVRGKNHTFLTMTDEGTTGLTGRRLTAEELLEDLPEQERWGRFENVAFTKVVTAEFAPLGSRGRGKFIFVGASQVRTILYDTLRPDGTYRLGARTIEKTSSPIVAFDDDEGKTRLARATEGALSPLAKVGTRIIIVDPIPELVQAIKDGTFAQYIGETWWEIIGKFDTKIVIKEDSKETAASIPQEFKLPETDTKDTKVWIRKLDKIELADGEVKVKRLHLMCNLKKRAPEDLRGIAIQRGGMKVCTIEPRYLPRNLTESISGYITVDEDSELGLREAEGLEHYSYDFSKPVPRAIKHYAQREVEKFAGEKLGWGADVKAIQQEKQRSAERRALAAINRIARELGLSTGPGPQDGGGGGGPRKPVRLQFPDFVLPRPGDRRVNYNETVTGIEVSAVNETGKAVRVRAHIFLRYDDTPMRDLTATDLDLHPGKPATLVAPSSETCTQAAFPNKGYYVIVARLVSLMPKNKGEKLDEKRRGWYVEQDPPTKGLFEKCRAVAYPSEFAKSMGRAIDGEAGGWILEYNIEHPGYDSVAEEEADLADYLFGLMAQEVCRIDAMKDTPKLYEKADLESPDAILRKTLRNTGEFHYRYYGGK